MRRRAIAVVEPQALARPAQSDPLRSLTSQEIEVLRNTIAKGLDDHELRLFITFCQHKGLDPFTREVYAFRRWDARSQKWIVVFGIGIDGFRSLAERTGQYAGQLGPFWCGQDGVWKDVWLADEPPAAAKVGVLRHGWQQPLWAVARWKSYAQTAKDGRLVESWARMPDLMLAKVAEALALRRAFPRQLGGLYAPEEFGAVSLEELRQQWEPQDEDHLAEEPEHTGVPGEHQAPEAAVSPAASEEDHGETAERAHEPLPPTTDDDWIEAIRQATTVQALTRIGNAITSRYRTWDHPVRREFRDRLECLKREEVLALTRPFGWGADQVESWMRRNGLQSWTELTGRRLSALVDEAAAASEA